MQSITEQQPADYQFEVIVIDNGSTDDTKNVCDQFGKLLENFVYCYEDEPGQLTGRHRGTELSTGNILSFIDDDVELNPHWLKSILNLFQEQATISIIGGPSLPKYQQYPPKWISYFWQPTPYGGSMCLPLSLIDIGCDYLEIDPLYVFGLNYSIRKNVLLELGGFHPDCIPQDLQKYQGDGETGLSLKAKSRGVKALYVSSAMLYHQVTAERMTTAYFEKWHYYDGVCQSFTDLRCTHKPYAGNKVPLPASRLSRVVSKTGNIFRKVLKRNNLQAPGEILQLQSAFSRKYHEGYRFHQLSFETDAGVREWVLRSDYWSYKIPL